jgi:hypothetical protein
MSHIEFMKFCQNHWSLPCTLCRYTASLQEVETHIQEAVRQRSELEDKAGIAERKGEGDVNASRNNKWQQRRRAGEVEESRVMIRLGLLCH